MALWNLSTYSTCPDELSSYPDMILFSVKLFKCSSYLSYVKPGGISVTLTVVVFSTSYNPLIFHVWCWFQWACISIISLIFFNYAAEIGYQILIYFGGFMYLSIASMTLLMDKHWSAIYVEMIKNIIAVVAVFFYRDWFMLHSSLVMGPALIATYHILCMFMTGYYYNIFRSEIPA